MWPRLKKAKMPTANGASVAEGHNSASYHRSVSLSFPDERGPHLRWMVLEGKECTGHWQRHPGIGLYGDWPVVNRASMRGLILPCRHNNDTRSVSGRI
ncbi:hypothetical protein DPEC_G00217440 [Dallia pectoralis]|uniref:Uncharacterized protein n=1 Tax=Dallia pectoralis TaxID=75939 RepID=A0ACC2G2V4_DALPE|nr:hypothetical protein DPEC_G00217440 [Dallia pectoralis]